jgi:hypothetical protein
MAKMRKIQSENIYEKIAILYEKLEAFKRTRNFDKYGFGEGGKNRWWLIRVNKLYSEQRKKASVKEITCLAALQLLANAYVIQRPRWKPFMPEHVYQLKKQVVDPLKKHNALMPKQYQSTIWQRIKKWFTVFIVVSLLASCNASRNYQAQNAERFIIIHGEVYHISSAHKFTRLTQSDLKILNIDTLKSKQ